VWPGRGGSSSAPPSDSRCISYFVFCDSYFHSRFQVRMEHKQPRLQGSVQ
jgi:hypothetical protein